MLTNPDNLSVISSQVQSMVLPQSVEMGRLECERTSSNATNLVEIPAQESLPTSTPAISLRRQKTRSTAPISQKKPRSAIPPEELDSAQLKGALSERRVPIPRQATRAKLFTLYTKHVLNYDIPPPKTTLCLTPAAELNMDSLNFSAERLPAFEGADAQDHAFDYSLATVADLKADLLRHGIRTKSKARKDKLRELYNVEVLKISPEEASQDLGIPIRTYLSHQDPPALNLHGIENGCLINNNTLESSTGPHTSPAFANAVLERNSVGQTTSKYSKYKVMDLRKMLKPFPCVVRGLKKDALVDLCEKHQPEILSDEVTPYARPLAPKKSKDTSTPVASSSTSALFMQAEVHRDESHFNSKMTPQTTSISIPPPDVLVSKVLLYDLQEKKKINEGDAAMVDQTITPNYYRPAAVTPLSSSPKILENVQTLDNEETVIQNIKTSGTLDPPAPGNEKSTPMPNLSRLLDVVLPKDHEDVSHETNKNSPPKDWLCDSSDDELGPEVLERPEKRSLSNPETPKNGKDTLSEHKIKTCVEKGGLNLESSAAETSLDSEKFDQNIRGEKYILKAPPRPRKGLSPDTDQELSPKDSQDASPLAKNRAALSDAKEELKENNADQINGRHLNELEMLLGLENHLSVLEVVGSVEEQVTLKDLMAESNELSNNNHLVSTLSDLTVAEHREYDHCSSEDVSAKQAVVDLLQIEETEDNKFRIEVVSQRVEPGVPPLPVIPESLPHIEQTADDKVGTGAIVLGVESNVTPLPVGSEVLVNSAELIPVELFNEESGLLKTVGHDPEMVNDLLQEEQKAEDESGLDLEPLDDGFLGESLKRLEPVGDEPKSQLTTDFGAAISSDIKDGEFENYEGPQGVPATWDDDETPNHQSVWNPGNEDGVNEDAHEEESKEDGGIDSTAVNKRPTALDSSAAHSSERSNTPKINHPLETPDRLVDLLEDLRLGQLSLREQLVEQASKTNEGIERMDGASRVQMSRLDMKVSDLHEQMRRNALDMEQVMESIEGLRFDRDKDSVDSPGPKKSPARSVSKSPIIPKSSRLSGVIRFHCSNLLGFSQSKKEFPIPATEEEKETWLQELEEEIASEEERSGEDNDEFEDGEESQHSKIVRRFLHKHGVKRFAPDFTQSVNSPENKFLWDLAVKLLVQLVECGEYTGVCLTETPVETIAFHLRKHVKDSLKKRFRMQNKWSEEELEAHAKASRRASRIASLREIRRETAMMVPDLEAFVEFVNACCSDDESIDEEASFDAPKNSFRKRLTCQVQQLPWRSLEVERIMVSLDARKKKHDESSPTKPTGPLGRTRKRITNSNTSTLAVPTGLPIDFYDTLWLSKLTPLELSALGIDINPRLKEFLATLKL